MTLEYSSIKTLSPILIGPSSYVWLKDISNNEDNNLTWKYMDSDLQQDFHMQISRDSQFSEIVIEPTSGATLINGTLNKYYIPIISAYPNIANGIYYWRVRCRGTAHNTSSGWSDFSYPNKLKIDITQPVVENIDVVSLSDICEYHSNLKQATSQIGYKDGIFISSDEYSGMLSIDISYPFDSSLSEGNKKRRLKKRTYFIDVYFPDLSTTQNLEINSSEDVYVEKGITDPSSGIYPPMYGFVKFNDTSFIPKISATLFVNDENINPDVIQYSQREKWYIKFPHNNVIIIRCFFIEEDYVFNLYDKYISPNGDISQFRRNYTFTSIYSEASTKDGFTFDPLIIRSAFSLLKLGNCLTPPNTYVTSENNSLNLLPQYCFSIGFNSLRKLELIDNGYYRINSETKNTVVSLGNINSDQITSEVVLDLPSASFSNLRKGDIFYLLNSHFYYKNNSSQPNQEFGVYRNFRNYFEINEIDSVNKSLSLSGIDTYFKYINEKKYDPTDTENDSILFTGIIEYDSINDVSVITSDTVLSSLSFTSEGGNNIGDHSLVNFFVGINDNEFPIIDSSETTLTIDGDIVSYLNIADESEIDFYISGDSYTIYNNALFIDKNTIRIFVNTSNNISGIKSIKVLESIPSTSLYQFNQLNPPYNIRYSLVRSSVGNITGPTVLYYNISSVSEENGIQTESILSDTIKVIVPDNNSYYVQLQWTQSSSVNNVGSRSYRIYGRSSDENSRYLISQVDYSSYTPNSTRGLVAWNDYGEITFNDSEDSLLYNTNIFNGQITSLTIQSDDNNGFLSGDNQTYNYMVSSFKIVNNLFYYGSTIGLTVSKTITNNLNNNSIILTWDEVSGCDGYRIYGRDSVNNRVLLNTIFGSNKLTYEDPGLSYVNKNLNLTTNIKYTRSSVPAETSFVFYEAFAFGNSSQTSLTDGIDIKYIDYNIINKEEEFLDLYFIVNGNSDIVSDDSLDLKTISISKKLPQTKCIYDSISPSGELKIYQNHIPQTSTGNACIDFSEFVSNTDPLQYVSFSNFEKTQHTNKEFPYTSNKYWKFGYDVNMQISDVVGDSYWTNSGNNANYGTSIDGNNSFVWAKIPVVNSILPETPIATSNISDNIFYILGKKIYLSTRESDSETLTCLDFTSYNSTTGNYELLVKLKGMSSSSISDYLNNNFKKQTILIASTTEYEDNEDLSFVGVNGFLKNVSSIPYRMASYPNIDFKESSAPEYEPSSIGEFPRIQYLISDLLLEGSKYVDSLWYGYFYIPTDGLYIFSVGNRGEKISLFIDDNVDMYYKYLGKTLEPTVFVKGNNIKYRTWIGSTTVSTTPGGSSTTTSVKFTEHIYSEQNSAQLLVNSDLINLKKGWHKFRLNGIYKISDSQRPIKNNVLSLFYQMINNEVYNVSYPKITSIDTENNTIDYSFPDGFVFDTDSIIGNICLLGTLLPTGSATTSQDRSVIEGLLYDLGSTTVSNKKYRKLKLELAHPETFSVSTGNHFDFIQPNIKKMSFAPIKSFSYSSGTGVILSLSEDEIPLPSFSSEETSNYRLFKWLMKIKTNENNTIGFSSPITGTITDVIVDEDNNKTKIYAEELVSSYYYLDFYGYPVFFNDDSSTLYQVLLVGDGYFEINGELSNPDNYIDYTYTIGSLDGLVSENDTFFVNLGKTLGTFKEESINKSCLPVYIKVFDRFGNEQTSKLMVSVKTSFDPNNADSQVYSGSVIEYYIAGSNINTSVVTGIGSQVYDANIIEKSVGIYESDVIVGGSGFSFWKEISWDADILNDDDVLVEVRTAPTEEELLTKTYNENAFGIVLSPFNILSFDVPEINPTGVNIISFTSNGELDSDNKVIKNKFLQFRLTLQTTSGNFSPKVNSVTVTYNTSSSVLLMSKNFTLSSNITGGILTANTNIPDGTSIEWGINTEDSTDFDRFYKINIDEAFAIPENLRDTQFKIGCVMTSSKDNVPKIYEIAFQFTCEDSEELLNLDL